MSKKRGKKHISKNLIRTKDALKRVLPFVGATIGTAALIVSTVKRITDSKKCKQRTELDKEIIAVHEAGHTIINRVLRKQNKIQEVSIIPKKEAAGYTLTLDDNRMLPQRQELYNTIVMLLGGKVAEEIYFGTVSVSTSSDLEKATDIAHSMVCYFAMSENTYIVRRYGDEIFNQQLEEKNLPKVEKIVADAYEDARKVIFENYKVFLALKEELMKKSILNSSELEELFSKFGI